MSISKTPRTQGWEKAPGSVDPRFAVGLPFLVPEILEFKVARDSTATAFSVFLNQEVSECGNPTSKAIASKLF